VAAQANELRSKCQESVAKDLRPLCVIVGLGELEYKELGFVSEDVLGIGSPKSFSFSFAPCRRDNRTGTIPQRLQYGVGHVRIPLASSIYIW
jgi:hypothetical protein